MKKVYITALFSFLSVTLAHAAEDISVQSQEAIPSNLTLTKAEVLELTNLDVSITGNEMYGYKKTYNASVSESETFYGTKAAPGGAIIKIKDNEYTVHYLRLMGPTPSLKLSDVMTNLNLTQLDLLPIVRLECGFGYQVEIQDDNYANKIILFLHAKK